MIVCPTPGFKISLGDSQGLSFFLAHPNEVFTEKGYSVALANPKGGFAPLDPKILDFKDEANACSKH